MRKLGEKILPEIIPILEDGLRSDKSDERQGVCIGLSEIMKSTSKDAVRKSYRKLLTQETQGHQAASDNQHRHVFFFPGVGLLGVPGPHGEEGSV